MAESNAKKKNETRTFVKETRDGPITRSVSTVSDEVSATFDGFVEQASPAKSSTSSTSSRAAVSSTSSPS